MLSVQFLAFLVALVDLVTGGLISNGFIVKVVIVEWASSRSLASNEQLLLSQGISNICIAIAVAATMLHDYFVASNNVGLQVIYSFVTVFTFFRFWNTAWISFFYCIKIVNSSCSFFLWCKLRISWLIPRLLLGSLAMSLAVFIFAFQNILIYHLNNGTTKEMDMSQGTIEVDYGASLKSFILFFGSACPLLVVLFCSILVVASLFRHICRMTGKEYSLRSLQTKVHIKAAGTIIALLLLYVSFYTSQSLLLKANLRGFKLTLITLIKLSNGSMQAITLILGNPKLKQAATQMLQRPTFLRTK
nr:PREDICTED: taste receptor type 2 member 9-like [Anolis carolinensis]|eukprot:XP_008103320.1 PREDICTED: taste receptor type 2 member 9-like [Anolis carolinensis]